MRLSIKAKTRTGQITTLNEFIFMAGVVFIMSQAFKRGVEIQSDNDLTI
jgi:hypothetical protein